jgi:speckle-type POZ protein
MDGWVDIEDPRVEMRAFCAPSVCSAPIGALQQTGRVGLSFLYWSGVSVHAPAFDLERVRGDSTATARHIPVHQLAPRIYLFIYTPHYYERSGFARFIHRADLGEYAGSNGRATVMCVVSVLDDYTLTSIADAPPLQEKKGIAALLSEVGDHLGCLLDSAALSDVSFVVGGDDEAPPLRAHRAILAARSPVFKAQFCGHMLEANTDAPSLIITVPDMDSETFKTMLRFMYTDNLPAGLGHDDEGEDEALLSLLAAADRYALDRLKLLCARKLLSNMTVDTVATLLDCAETYNCPDLKTMCIEFVLDDENFDKVVLTDSFIDLVVTRSPLLLAEMRNIAFFRNNEKHIA